MLFCLVTCRVACNLEGTTVKLTEEAQRGADILVMGSLCEHAEAFSSIK